MMVVAVGFAVMFDIAEVIVVVDIRVVVLVNVVDDSVMNVVDESVVVDV